MNPETPTPHKNKVLLVEDDLALMSMLANMLNVRGIEVLEAVDGVEGMRRAEEERPDLLLIDIETPKLSGIAMLRELRERGLNTPAIILSNSSHPLNVALAAELGIKEYLVKADWEVDEVADKVLSHLKTHQL